jgi:hypothetical protein
MTSVRLAIFALLACPLFAVAQAGESPLHVDAAQRLQVEVSQYKGDGDARVTSVNRNLDRGIEISLDGESPADETCYMIRSYVVARDSKDSDSVHPVRYTICQPGSRFHLRTTQAQPVLPER